MTRKIAWKISLTIFAGLLTGCSLSSHPAGGTTVVSVPLPQNGNALSAFNTPTNIQSFDCYAVNVTGPGIAPIQGCPNGLPGQYVGILAGPVPVSAGSISVEVPNGNDRTFQLIGFDTNDGSCHPFGSGQNGAGYLLSSQSSVNVPTSQVISLHPSFATGQALTEFTGGCAIAPALAVCTPNSVQTTWCSGGSWGSLSSHTYDGAFLTGLKSIAIDSSNNIYVLDSGNYRVQKFNSSGVVQGSIGEGTNGFTLGATIGAGTPISGGFGGGGAIAISSSSIFVSDALNSEIAKFDMSGHFQSSIGPTGTGDGTFNSPWGIAVDSISNIYIADQLNYRVQRLNPSGTGTGSTGFSTTSACGLSTPLASWSLGCTFGAGGAVLDGAFSDPFGIALNSTSTYFYVTDDVYDRVDEFLTSSGDYVGSIGYAITTTGSCIDSSAQTSWCTGGTFSFGTGDGQFSAPKAVALDSSGNLYVVDTDNNRIEKFSANGSFLGSIGEAYFVGGVPANKPACVVGQGQSGWCYAGSNGNFQSGSGDGEFNDPTGVAVDSSGYIYVVDSGNNRIERFTSAGQFYGSIGYSN